MAFNQIARRLSSSSSARRVLVFPLVLLAIEFLDELVDSSRMAAWPLIRNDLNLSYAQIGLLLSVPSLISTIIEPPLGILADIWKRRVLVLGGGLMFALAVLLVAVAPSFPVLLLAFTLFYPASGAFVSLSQATLMDLDPTRHEQWMARWTLSGSVAVLVGPLALGVASWLGFGWRGLFGAIVVLTLALAFAASRQPFPNGQAEEGEEESLVEGVKGALRSLRQWAVLRWLLLLECADLLGDIFNGFLALYFVDVVGVSPLVAGTALALGNGATLVGDIALVPLLARVRGLKYLRYSVAGILFLYPLFLLAPTLWMKLALLVAIQFGSAGWYTVLMGQLYSAMPGRSGTVTSISSVSGLIGSVVPAVLGLVAERFGLQAALWVLAIAPITLLVGLPRARRKNGE